MVMLFVTGVMNLLWIAILSALVLAEKLLPQGHLLSRLAGVAILAWAPFCCCTLK
jgi:predicted metal-binding membrane protein